MARSKHNGNKGKKENNPRYLNNYHSNRDKKPKSWKISGKRFKEKKLHLHKISINF